MSRLQLFSLVVNCFTLGLCVAFGFVAIEENNPSWVLQGFLACANAACAARTIITTPPQGANQ